MDIRKVHRTARGGINNDRTLLYLLPDIVPFLILSRASSSLGLDQNLFYLGFYRIMEKIEICKCKSSLSPMSALGRSKRGDLSVRIVVEDKSAAENS